MNIGIINVIFGVISTLTSALAIILWNKLKTLEAKADTNEAHLSDFKTHVAENYSHKKDNQDMEKRINERLDRLEIEQRESLAGLGKRLDEGFNMIYNQLLKGKK